MSKYTKEQLTLMQRDFTRVLKREVRTEWYIDSAGVQSYDEEHDIGACVDSDLLDCQLTAAELQLRVKALHGRSLTVYEASSALYNRWHKQAYHRQGGASMRECKQVLEQFLDELSPLDKRFTRDLLYCWEHLCETVSSYELADGLEATVWSVHDQLQAKYKSGN